MSKVTFIFIWLISNPLFAQVSLDPIHEAAKKTSEAYVKSGSKVLAIGESTHGHRLQKIFVNKIVSYLSSTLDWVALEHPSSLQPELDHVLSGKLSDKIKNSDLRSFLSEVAQINSHRLSQGIKPIKVIAIDLSSEGFKSESEWFFQRDQHMVRTLISETNGLQGKGLIHMGLAHLSRVPFQLPRFIRAKMGVSDASELLTFASRLIEQSQLNAKEYYLVTLNSRIPFIESFASIPIDYKSFYNFLNKSPLTLFGNTTLAEVEKKTSKAKTFPIPIKGNLDGIVNLPNSIGLTTQCRLVLKNKKLLLRGVNLRILHWKSR